jgi:hypothetical protein
MQQFDPRISDFEDAQNYVNAQNVRDEEQEAIDTELRDQDDTMKMCEEQYLVGMEENSHLV